MGMFDFLKKKAQPPAIKLPLIGNRLVFDVKLVFNKLDAPDEVVPFKLSVNSDDISEIVNEDLVSYDVVANKETVVRLNYSPEGEFLDAIVMLLAKKQDKPDASIGQEIIEFAGNNYVRDIEKPEGYEYSKLPSFTRRKLTKFEEDSKSTNHEFMLYVSQASKKPENKMCRFPIFYYERSMETGRAYYYEAMLVDSADVSF